jgi:outer membrane protein TolC
MRKHVPLAALFLLWMSAQCPALTVDDAVSLAREKLPSYKAAETQVKATDALYKASLAPYLPSLDTATAHERHQTRTDDFDLSTYDVTLSYILFDGGRRRADRKIARLNLEIDKENVEVNLLQLRFDVTSAFYTAMARSEILSHRRVQQQDAQKDYEVARGRHQFGVARLSDVLQASVRLEQAKFNRIQAEGDLKNGLSDLNSLIGRPLGSSYDLDGSLGTELKMVGLDKLVESALERPEIKQGEHSIGIAESTKSVEKSAFFPVVTANASYNRIEGGPSAGGLGGGGGSDGTAEDKTIGITATWNVFELGKFYRTKSAGISVNVSEEQLSDTTRQVLLDLQKAYQDYLTASENIGSAQEQLNQAEHSYSQALGEYRVGKGDILALVQAESALAVAREQLTTAKLNLAVAKAQVERTAGIERLESLAP